jgi:hypothetical protein
LIFLLWVKTRLLGETVAGSLSRVPQDRWPTCQQLIAELTKATA